MISAVVVVKFTSSWNHIVKGGVHLDDGCCNDFDAEGSKNLASVWSTDALMQVCIYRFFS